MNYSSSLLFHQHPLTWCVCLICRYILVYPQGCDVCNHLSLFLCVADYDKLLPGKAASVRLTWCAHPSTLTLHRLPQTGWSHFAQFTIAVVNKDPKKSKYSGTYCRPTASLVVAG